MERKTYEVIVKDGKFFYKHSGEILQTCDIEDSESKWIFVLSTSKVLYVGKRKKGTLHHSSLLGGGATVAAGRLVVENGVLKAVWLHSEHYQNFMDVLFLLRENNVDITDAKMSLTDEEEDSLEEDFEAEKTIFFQDKADPSGKYKL